MGSGRRNVIGLWSEDPVLAWVGPIGLALAAGTALVVDTCDLGGVNERTLADVARTGPRLDELSPGRTGVASIASGRLSVDQLRECVAALASSWPAVVLRSGAQSVAGIPIVPYRTVYPGILADAEPRVSVWQPALSAPARNLPGMVLPRIGRNDLMAMLHGRRPTGRRWIRSWRRVWEVPWA